VPGNKHSKSGHTGCTDAGHTRDVKVERIGKVTVYRRGSTYYLYYRQGGHSQRRKVDGNLAVARATAHKVVAALDEGRASPIAYTRTSPEKMVAGFLDAVANVQRLALRTQDRYRAALDRFLDFCRDARIGTVDTVQEATVENFVKWLRNQKRVRNGAARGKREVYRLGGVKFILATCRTAFNWGARHRLLPPFTENPFTRFPIEKLKDPSEKIERAAIFSREQERDFFAACDAWQRGMFEILATYGLRLGELTHLLVEDVDLENGFFVIRSKPWLFWTVKTGRERRLPLIDHTKEIFTHLIDEREAGFVFLNEEFATGRHHARGFASHQALRTHAEKVAADLLLSNPDANERMIKRAVVRFCRTAGQVPEKRVRCEFMGLTARIGCPEFTRVHDLRHLFSSRAQEAGVNPILVQEMLGHTTLEMTRRYTHLGLDTKRDALSLVREPGDRVREH
jgi:integrase